VHARVDHQILATTMLLIYGDVVLCIEHLGVEANVDTLAEIVHGDQAGLRSLDRHRPEVGGLSSLHARIASLQATVVALAPRWTEHFRVVLEVIVVVVVVFRRKGSRFALNFLIQVKNPFQIKINGKSSPLLVYLSLMIVHGPRRRFCSPTKKAAVYSGEHSDPETRIR
jgi:hypothetical protein